MPASDCRQFLLQLFIARVPGCCRVVATPMKSFLLILRIAFVSIASALILGAEQSQIDWNHARELNRRFQRGEKLSQEENAYLNRAREVRASAAPQRGNPRETRPLELSEQPIRHFTPLTDLADELYEGELGGLYGGGLNIPSEPHRLAALNETAKIKRLDHTGKPSESGKIVLLSLGMSNTTQEFSRFKQLSDHDPEKSASLVIVDGAQGGQDAVKTSKPSAPFWSKIDDRLGEADVTPLQVQAVWIKQAIAGPRAGFPVETKRLQELLAEIVRIAKTRYPNLRVAYLSSRIYAGYATSQLNPEPYAYESAFSVRGLILEQVGGNDALNFNPEHGAVRAPVLLWGPYLWGDGMTPRKSDDLIWRHEDLAADGTHPSNSGRQKVAEMLLKFFKTDPTTKAWFLESEI